MHSLVASPPKNGWQGVVPFVRNDSGMSNAACSPSVTEVGTTSPMIHTNRRVYIAFLCPCMWSYIAARCQWCLQPPSVLLWSPIQGGGAHCVPVSPARLNIPWPLTGTLGHSAGTPETGLTHLQALPQAHLFQPPMVQDTVTLTQNYKLLLDIVHSGTLTASRPTHSLNFHTSHYTLASMTIDSRTLLSMVWLSRAGTITYCLLRTCQTCLTSFCIWSIWLRMASSKLASSTASLGRA